MKDIVYSGGYLQILKGSFDTGSLFDEYWIQIPVLYSQMQLYIEVWSSNG